MFRSISTSLLWRGIIAVAIGVVSVAWPQITLGAFVILFAVYCFTAAVVDAARAFRSPKAGQVVGNLLLALLSVVAGIIALAFPGMTAVVLTLFVGAWALVTGVTEIVLAFRRGETAGERAMWALGGLISVALAVVLVVRPDIGAVSLASVFGLFCIVTGVATLVLALQTRKVDTEANRLAHSAA